ncbi:hypothetical protein HY285_04200 [Candidatus Peregrinibacteria bacterium]|nr:hypothetical protein [Candidatus Peregrinibacteria bacterium]MBI3816715.1 hypothetical protein [Candidatus Peregrinibacteria bacterium]
MPIPQRQYRELYALIAAAKNKREVESLLNDLLTPQELASLAQRWQEIQLLARGIPQREIAAKIGVSISKITRGSHALQYGTGAFKTMLKRMGKRSEK